MRTLFIALDRPDVQFASNDICRATAQPRRFALRGCGGTRDSPCLPRSSDSAMRTGIMPCDTEELRLPTHFMLGRHPIFAATTTPSCDLSAREIEFFTAARGACRTLGLTALMLVLNFSMHAELRTDGTAAKGLASLQRAGLVRHIHCPALGWQQAIARRTIRMEKQAASTRSDDVGTTTGIRRCGNCSRDAAVTDVRDELMLHLKTCDGSSA